MITTQDFIPSFHYETIEKTKISAQCSSNIALVKYWGKYDPQIPANPSISFTLTNSFTQTELEIEKSENFSVEVYLENKKQEQFAEKIEKYFKHIEKYLPFILDYKYIIKTHNSFPHSSGIASSASGFGAIAFCLIDFSERLGETLTDDFKKLKASFLARLGSGSACRSIDHPLSIWGKCDAIPNSSDIYAIPFPFKTNPVFDNFQDTILLIHEGKKDISSTLGHQLMKDHPYADTRFLEAQKNINKLSEILQNGNLKSFGELIEHEALSLHAMMLTSHPAFILMKPETISAINKIWEYRRLSNNHLYFTLDAGANIHLLYPKNEKDTIKEFIFNDLIKYTEKGNIIEDYIS